MRENHHSVSLEVAAIIYLLSRFGPLTFPSRKGFLPGIKFSGDDGMKINIPIIIYKDK